MPPPAPKPPAIVDENRRRRLDAVVGERLPDVDVPAWMLFTYTLGAGRRAEQFLAGIVRRHDLDGSQFSVLVVLWMSGPPHRLSPTALSRFIAQSPSGMTHTVKRLNAAGLVGRVGLESDGRAWHVELTGEGLERVTRCAAELAAAVEELFPRRELPVDDLAEAGRLVVNAFSNRLRT